MDEKVDKIQMLIHKANAVVQFVKILQNEKKELLEEIDELKAVLELEKNTNFGLQEELKVLRLAKQIEGAPGDNKEVKEKINELLKEVDKCIAWLND